MCDIKVIPTAMSDHDTIGCRRKLNNYKQPPETIRCRDFSNYEPNSLRNDLRNESFNTVYAEENPNQAWKCMKSILGKIFDHYATPRIFPKESKEKSLLG